MGADRLQGEEEAGGRRLGLWLWVVRQSLGWALAGLREVLSPLFSWGCGGRGQWPGKAGGSCGQSRREVSWGLQEVSLGLGCLRPAG